MSDVQQSIVASFKATGYLWNNPDGSLPFSLYHPVLKDEQYWICDRDKDTAILSIYVYTHKAGEKEYKTDELKDMKDAENHRDTLLQNGWKPRFHPTIEFK